MSISWSFSSFTTALSCLQKYKYIYIDKIIPEAAESGDMAFGSALHSAINSSLTDNQAELTFDTYWDSYQNKELEYGRYKWQQLKALGQEFIRKFNKMHRDRYVLEYAETRLYGEYKGIRLEGTPDYYGLYDGKRSLRDFKTSGRNYESEKGDLALQLYLYAYLYKKSFPKSVIETLGYTVFNKGLGSIQDLTWEFREEDMYKALDNLVDYVETWDLEKNNEGIYPKNYGNCLSYNRKCEYYNKCHKENK